MPLKRRGSVSARLSVWFSRRSASTNAARVASSGSSPPRANCPSPVSPRTRWSEARFFELASVISSVPVEKSNAASPTLPGTFAPRAPQRKRPAIIKWKTRNRSPSSPSTIRLPMRRSSRTVRPSASRSGGSTERSRNGLASRARSYVCPSTRAPIASM